MPRGLVRRLSADHVQDIEPNRHSAANLLSELGRYADVLAVIEEPVTIYRDLAAARRGPVPPPPGHVPVQPRHPVRGTGSP
jgi:hypothetical protein